MANLVYYKEEREQFKDAFATKLSQGDLPQMIDPLQAANDLWNEIGV